MKRYYGRITGTPGPVTALPWTPASLPALRGWWNPAILKQEVGTPVMELPSMAGPHNTLQAVDTASAPVLGTLLGKAALVIDGYDDVMWMTDKAATSGAKAITLFALLKMDVIHTDARLAIIIGSATAAATAGGTRVLLGLRNVTGPSKPWAAYHRDTDVSTTQTIPSLVDPDLNQHVLIGRWDRSPAGNMHTEIWLDGTNILTDDRLANEPAWDEREGFGNYIGNRQGTDQSMAGRIAQVGITRSALGTSDRQKLEGYLAHYGGIPHQLPPGHPFELTPPA
jgi:hypothetical protein